jgi:hypothetical protein
MDINVIISIACLLVTALCIAVVAAYNKLQKEKIENMDLEIIERALKDLPYHMVITDDIDTRMYFSARDWAENCDYVTNDMRDHVESLVDKMAMDVVPVKYYDFSGVQMFGNKKTLKISIIVGFDRENPAVMRKYEEIMKKHGG